MICNDKFTFINLHNTNSEAVLKLLCELIPKSEEIGIHSPVQLRPENHQNKPVIGIVRNPWDWYLSWYLINKTNYKNDSLFKLVSRGGQANFKSTIINLINFGDDKNKSKEIRTVYHDVLPATFDEKNDDGFSKSCINAFVSNEKGYYSLLVDRMFGTDYLFHMISKFEEIEISFIQSLNKLSIELTDDVRFSFTNINNLSEPKHSHYSYYYDEELRDLITQKEAALISKFDYKFIDQKQVTNSSIIPIPQQQPFAKVLGTTENFVKLGLVTNMEPLINLVNQLSEEEWAGNSRVDPYNMHHQTHSVPLLYDNLEHIEPEEHTLYPRFRGELKPILDHILNIYGNEDKGGLIIRVVVARLKPFAKIGVHYDTGATLLNCNRVHLPIVTNDKINFMVGGENKNMRVGELYEINNSTFHAVENNSDQARIHIIIDWTVRNTLNKAQVTNKQDSLNDTIQ